MPRVQGRLTSPTWMDILCWEPVSKYKYPHAGNRSQSRAIFNLDLVSQFSSGNGEPWPECHCASVCTRLHPSTWKTRTVCFPWNEHMTPPPIVCFIPRKWRTNILIIIRICPKCPMVSSYNVISLSLSLSIYNIWICWYHIKSRIHMHV